MRVWFATFTVGDLVLSLAPAARADVKLWQLLLFGPTRDVAPRVLDDLTVWELLESIDLSRYTLNDLVIALRPARLARVGIARSRHLPGRKRSTERSVGASPTTRSSGSPRRMARTGSWCR